MRTFRLFLPLLFLLLSAPLARADTITFEGLADGTAVTNQFPDLLFLHATAATAGASLNEFEFPPHSGSNVVFDDGGAMTISFATPVAGVGGFFTYTTRITITAFDASSNILGSFTSAFDNNTALSGDPGSLPNELLSFGLLAGIARITIAGDPGGGSFTLDDLTFSSSATAVPEPSTLVLLLTGGGMYFFKKRHRH
jgi:hypothetical protein